MVIRIICNLFTAPLDIVYSIKWIIAYVAIRVYNACHKRRFDLYDLNAEGDPVKLGFMAPELEKELESPYPESHLQEASDEVMFYGVNSKSECLLVRISRGCDQVSEAWIHLKLESGKSYHLTENSGYQQSSEGKCLSFSCGKLKMHYLSPMRRWRIFFCGMLKETSEDTKESGKLIFVKFAFLWKTTSEVYDLTLFTNPDGFASALARSEWKLPGLPPVFEFSDALNFYAQTGIINGTISVNESPDYEIYLFGEKTRNIGKSENIVGCKFLTVMGNTPVSGLWFHLGRSSAPYIFHNLPSGFVVQPNGQLTVVKELDITIKPFSDQKYNCLKAVFTAGEKYEISGSFLGEPIVLYSGQGGRGFLEVCFIEFKIGTKKGMGLIMSGEVHEEQRRRPIMTSRSLPFPRTVPLTVQFTDDISQFAEISGGKGSSLGKLTEFSSDRTFIVPKGTIVTTAAYREFWTPELRDAVRRLENVAYGNVKGDLKEACNTTSDTVVNTLLPNKICHSIIGDLKDMFGDEINQRKFAVRSSATGEDTDAMSAAGQMDTFLGVQGLKEILIAVKKCWASQFGYIAIEYKRRNGQPLNCPMAVVIQEMVSCDVSGVLFTCDPVTNNPSVITITANYGLGETVVSGSVEPDTITLRRTQNGGLEYDSVSVGTKHQRIVMQDSGGTVTEDVPEDSRNESCLSEEMALRLGTLAIEIETFYKSSRDIEWGICNDEICILQSRPVTNVAGATDYEIKHEFDAPLRFENEYFTVANCGEVMPGAASPLGIEMLAKVFGTVYTKQAINNRGQDVPQPAYSSSVILSFNNHIMWTIVQVMGRYGYGTPEAKGMMISIFGRVLDDPDLNQLAPENVTTEPKQSVVSKLRFYWDLCFHTMRVKRIKENLDNYHLNFLKYKTAKETFAALLSACSDFDDVVDNHLIASESSSNWNMYLFQILGRCKGNFENDVYSDVGRLLGKSSNVESADVPQALQDLAYQIEKDVNCEEFKNSKVEDAEQWLRTSTSPAGCKFKTFLKRHGHRCVKESDIRTIPWEMNPKPLVQLLQNLVGSCKDQNMKKGDDDGKIFSELNVHLGFVSRCLLKFVLPNCRRNIRAREAGKSLLMKSFDYLRKGVRHLAQQMVSEGRIPELDLIFFLMLDEIDELLKTRSPSIIARANSRKKMFPTLDNYKFPEIMKGIPRPINETADSAETYEFVADLTMKGFPVSQGVTKGYARVAITLDEASNLQPGEILITYGTDVGWSPYFPIISGVVTELGGLISHGAVVSREYGLPCVVGLHGATKKFRTGDYVLLDGKKGILQRLPQPEK